MVCRETGVQTKVSHGSISNAWRNRTLFSGQQSCVSGKPQAPNEHLMLWVWTFSD